MVIENHYYFALRIYIDFKKEDGGGIFQHQSMSPEQLCMLLIFLSASSRISLSLF